MMSVFQHSQLWGGRLTPVRLEIHLVSTPTWIVAQGAMKLMVIHTADFDKYRTAAINNATRIFQKEGKQPGSLLGPLSEQHS